MNVGVLTRRRDKENEQAQMAEHYCLVTNFEPENVSNAIVDECWLNAMKEEIGQIEKSKTWELVPRIDDKNAIGEKWVFSNKLDESRNVVRNKAHFFTKGMHNKKV